YTARLWDTRAGSELRRFGDDAPEVNRVSFTPDGRTALAATADGTVHLWDTESGKELHSFGTGGDWSFAFSADRRRALSVSRGHELRLWDVGTGEELRRLQ